MVHQSRRLCGLSPESVKPSPRRSRSNYASAFEPVLVNTTETNHSPRVFISQGEPSIIHNLDGNALVLARVLFELEDKVEIEMFQSLLRLL